MAFQNQEQQGGNIQGALGWRSKSLTKQELLRSHHQILQTPDLRQPIPNIVTGLEDTGIGISSKKWGFYTFVGPKGRKGDLWARV